MTLNKMIEIANNLARNNLSITRYNEIWQISTYNKDLRPKEAEAKTLVKALTKFIESFGLKIKTKKA